jgi:hypothetical protein
MGEKLKKIIFALLLSLSIFNVAYAVSVDLTYKTDNSGEIMGQVEGNEVVFTKYAAITGYQRYYSDLSFSSATKVGYYYILDVSSDNPNSARLHKFYANGTNSVIIFENQLVTLRGTAPTIGNGVSKSDYVLDIFWECNAVSDETALNCWIGKVFAFAQTAIYILSIGAIILAGILYMTSMGDPNRVGLAKKLLVGAASAIAIMVLGRFFLTKVIGVPWEI